MIIFPDLIRQKGDSQPVIVRTKGGSNVRFKQIDKKYFKEKISYYHELIRD